MKTLAVAAAILAGTFGIGIGTAAQAGEKLAAGSVPTIEAGGVSYRIGLDTDASWQHRPALEAGALPATGDSAVRDGGSRTADGVPTYEVSGRTYRAGIDDGP